VNLKLQIVTAAVQFFDWLKYW